MTGARLGRTIRLGQVRANAASGAILETGCKENPMERIILYHNPG